MCLLSPAPKPGLLLSGGGRMHWLTRLLGTRHSPYARGGTLPARPRDPDLIPCLLEESRSTDLRPGETLLEATERLRIGDDL